MAHHVSLLVLGTLLACGGTDSTASLPEPVSATNHPFFPIGPGAAHELGRQPLDSDPPLSCASCHPPEASSFLTVSCIGCHGHTPTIATRIHGHLPGFVLDGSACITCHAQSDHYDYDHAGVVDACAGCHEPGKTFRALPILDFVHPPMNGADCGACHRIDSWRTPAAATAVLQPPGTSE
jgi:hypothetical protein